MINEAFELINNSGLHARPASKFCAIARSHICEITVEYSDQTIDAKKILDVMAANLKKGMKINIICNGADEFEAMESLKAFVTSLDD